MHAFPSTQDAASLWHEAKQSAERLNPLAIISLPLVVVVYVANILSIFWFDLLYGVAVGLLLPELLLNKVI